MAKRTICFIITIVIMTGSAMAGKYTFSVDGDQLKLNGQTFKILGLRCSNALISDAKTNEVIDNLDLFKTYGVNTVSVFMMGSRFGDIKGYKPDSSLDPIYAARLGRIIEAADKRGMVILVGCLYWGTSAAKEDLEHWTQADANKAVANTIQWLSGNNYRNVFVDVDNEGMANDKKGWSIASMIDAAHAVDPTIMVAYNHTATPPSNADLYVHFSSKVAGKPWVDTESTPTNATGGYWGTYSKETHGNDSDFYNYSRIGLYTAAMKDNQYEQTRDDYDNYNGHMFASTWLQCSPDEGINGPHHIPGGHSNISDVNDDIDAIHPDAGILWWLQYIQDRYGPWVPPGEQQIGEGAFLEKDGVLCIEAEHYATQSNSTYRQYQNVHYWTLKADRSGYSGDGFMQVLPDEWPDGQHKGVSSPRDNSGAGMTYPIKVTTPGTYYVYVRGMSMGGESNGIHLGLNGQLTGTGLEASNMSGFRPYNQWIWESGRKDGYSSPARIDIPAGAHMLNIWNRDDGFRIDKIVLKMTQGTPTGTGPDESERGNDTP